MFCFPINAQYNWKNEILIIVIFVRSYIWPWGQWCPGQQGSRSIFRLLLGSVHTADTCHTAACEESKGGHFLSRLFGACSSTVRLPVKFSQAASGNRDRLHGELSDHVKRSYHNSFNHNYKPHIGLRSFSISIFKCTVKYRPTTTTDLSLYTHVKTQYFIIDCPFYYRSLFY